MHKITVRPFQITRSVVYNSPDEPSAVVQLNDKDAGILINRLTTDEIEQIEQPANGLLVYNTDIGMFEYFNQIEWIAIQIVHTEVLLMATDTLNWDIGTDPVARVIVNQDLTINVSGGYPACIARLGIVQGAGAPYEVTVTGVVQKGSTVWEIDAGGINILTVDQVGDVLVATIL